MDTWVKQIRHGTPLQLAAFIEGCGRELTFSADLSKSAEKVWGRIFLISGPGGRVVVDLSLLPKGKTLLRLQSDPKLTTERNHESWAHFAALWSALSAELSRVGFSEVKEKKRWEPRSAADRWFLEQYFDVHKAQKPSQHFCDEWLKRKKKEDNSFDPPNPNNNLQQLISHENKEREKENLH